MSYLVFARKWRPQHFSEVIGQDHITRTLINVIQQNRIAHAYLFTGPRGVGKTSMARILAKALNCEKGPAIDPCQICVSCTGITLGKSLDVLEIDGASNRGIDEIRQLRENIKFSPVSGKFRIYIIDEVHMLTAEAFNALLKTLEEPPGHVKFIFATTAPQRLPSTILSRCQRFNFRLITVKEIVGCLKKIILEEKISVSDEALYQIAREAQGSMRDAESILDQLVSFGEKEIEEKDVFLLMGRVSKDVFFKFAEMVIAKDISKGIEYFNKIMDHGESPQQLLIDTLDHLRNLLFVKIGKQGESQLDLIEEDLAVLRTHASKISEKDILSFIDTLSLTSQDMRWSSSPRLLMEITLIKIIGSANPINIQATPAPLPKEEPASSRKHEPVPAQKQTDGLNIDEIRSRWPEVIEIVKKQKMTAGACLVEGEPTKYHHPVLTVTFENGFNFHREIVEKPDNKKIIEKVLRDIFDQDMMMHCLNAEITESNASLKDTVKAASPYQSPHHDMVDKVIKTFKGRIIEK